MRVLGGVSSWPPLLGEAGDGLRGATVVSAWSPVPVTYVLLDVVKLNAVSLPYNTSHHSEEQNLQNTLDCELTIRTV